MSSLAKLFVGRPKSFESPEELQKKLIAYLRSTEPHIKRVKYIYTDKKGKQTVKVEKVITEQQPITIGTACVWLGIHRDTWNEYSKKNEYSDTIKRFKQICEAYAEERLFSGKGNVTGIIFNLKNNHGWKDKTEVEHSGEIKRDVSDEELATIHERAARALARKSEGGAGASKPSAAGTHS